MHTLRDVFGDAELEYKIPLARVFEDDLDENDPLLESGDFAVFSAGFILAAKILADKEMRDKGVVNIIEKGYLALLVTDMLVGADPVGSMKMAKEIRSEW